MLLPLVASLRGVSPVPFRFRFPGLELGRFPRLAVRPAVALPVLSAALLTVLLPAAALALPTDQGWAAAEAAYKAGRFEQAIEGFRAGAEADPDEPRWHFMLGVSLTRAGRPDEAVASLERAVELSGGAISYAMMLAKTQLQGGDLDAALATLDRHRPGDERPDLQPSWLGLLAETAGRMSQPQAAIPLLEGAVEQAPDRSDLRLALGRAQLLAGDSATAYRHYSAVASGEPRALQSAMEVAFAIASALPETDAAARGEWYERAADLAAGVPVADLPAATLLAAGDALLLAGRPELAESRFRAAAEAESPTTSALASYKLARSLLAQDDAEEALSLLAEVLAGGPEDELAQRAFAAQGQALAALERWEEAGAAYRRAGHQERAAEMAAVVAAIRHNDEVEAELAECRRRWADIARLRAENRDVEGTAAWAEIDRRADRLAAECGPEPVVTAGG